MKSTAIDNFLTAAKNMLERLANKIDLALVKTKKFNNSTLTLESSVVHVYDGTTGISNLTINYPTTGEFMSTVIFFTARSGLITVNFPQGTQFAGLERMKFYPNETWELNIHNGRVAGTLITKE